MGGPRIQIQDVSPRVDCGRWPAKAILGDRVEVSATIVRDGHAVLRATARHRPAGRRAWRETPLEPVGNDRWQGSFEADALGRWLLDVQAWLDPFATWLDEYDRKVAAGQRDLSGELAEGETLFGAGSVEDWRAEAPALATAERREATRLPKPLALDVERERARFGAWYELFPRSWGGFRGVRALLPRLAALGVDVLYLTPIHPIGRTNRKGRNNAESAAPGDPGSPWAIGGPEGGHDAVDPGLGTVAELEQLVREAAARGIEIALDFAIQCSPDHPWLREHPEWFRWRPDGSVAYAENPPKRYQDIVNVDWDTDDREGLWQALAEVVLGWCERGVRIFRVDNPHTKPVPFWEWLIARVRAAYPDAVFLSEAFTRPALMTTLAKAGFGQSYTYFTWKNTRAELAELVEQIRSWSAFYRPNFFANTPDILHAYLQRGGRPAFEARLVLAATLSPSYGIYSGFEACENVPLREGSEEYLDSEKYELKRRRLEGPLLPLYGRLNAIRREHPALQRFENVRLLETLQEQLFAFAKSAPGDVLVVVVNLDPQAEHDGLAIVPPDLGLPASYDVVDLLSGARYAWRTGRNYVKLAPGQAHVLHVRAAVARERARDRAAPGGDEAGFLPSDEVH
jgi:starch synthase (maltosyl-transferring)